MARTFSFSVSTYCTMYYWNRGCYVVLTRPTSIGIKLTLLVSKGFLGPKRGMVNKIWPFLSVALINIECYVNHLGHSKKILVLA